MIWVYCWEFVVTGDPEAFCQSVLDGVYDDGVFDDVLHFFFLGLFLIFWVCS